MSEVKIIEIRPLNDGRPLRAFVDVQVGDWIINEWRIFQREGERIQVAVPQVSWRGQDGKFHYRAMLSIPEELKQRVEVAILLAWEKEETIGKTKQ
jgi:hypothetical protein